MLLIVLMRDGDAQPAAAPVQQVAPTPQPQTAAPPPVQTYQQQPAPSPGRGYEGAMDPSVRSLADEAGGYEEPYSSEPADPKLSMRGGEPSDTSHSFVGSPRQSRLLVFSPGKRLASACKPYVRLAPYSTWVNAS